MINNVHNLPVGVKDTDLKLTNIPEITKPSSVEQTEINFSDDNKTAQLKQGSAIAEYKIDSDNDIASKFGYDSIKELQQSVGAIPDGKMGAETIAKLKNNLQNESKKLNEGLIKEIPNQLGVSNLKEAQEIIGATPDGVLGEETINKLDAFMQTDGFIKNNIEGLLKNKEFEIMVKMFQVNAQMMDQLLQLVEPK